METSPFKHEYAIENASPEINENIIKSEVLGGIKLNQLPENKTLNIETQNRVYKLEHRSDGLYLSGHPEFCPKPTKIKWLGSTWGGNMIMPEYVGRGMKLEYTGADKQIFTTSEIEDVWIEGEKGETSPEDKV